MGMKFSMDGGAGVPAGGGDGWRLVPDQVWAVLGSVRGEFDQMAELVGGLDRMAGGGGIVTVTPPLTVQGAAQRLNHPGPPMAPVAEDYHGAAEWGGPFGGAVAAALDQALMVQAEQANQMVAQVSAAVIGVSQATNAYQAGAQDMAATVQAEAVKAAESGDFSYFDYLQGP